MPPPARYSRTGRRNGFTGYCSRQSALRSCPLHEAARLPLHLRALKRVAWKYLVPLLPHFKARYPRLVMPGGYIERELSLRIFAHEYLPINLMDLLRFKRRFPNEPVDEIIRAGLALVQECRMFDRWPEIKGKEYAVGFWVEALYHACLLFPDRRFRVWLAQAVATARSLGAWAPTFAAGGEQRGHSATRSGAHAHHRRPPAADH